MAAYYNFCPSCGKQLPEGKIDFCPSCGKPQTIGQGPSPKTGTTQQPPQQYQQAPQQYPQYQQPPQQYQQPQQWNANGYYPPATAPKRGTPWWAWVLIGFVVLVVIGAAANAGKKPDTTTQAVVTNPPANSNPQSAPVQPTTRPVQSNPGSTGLVPDFALINAPGSAGQELVGQSGTQKDNFDISVNGVRRISEIHGNGKTITSQGIFLILTLDLKNISKSSEATLLFLKLTDSQGRTYSTSSNYEARTLISFSRQFPTDITIEPGFSGHAYEIFEIPSDATGLQLKIGL